MKTTVIAAAAATLAFAAQAGAFEVYTDYTPTKELWNVTMVRVNPNRIDDYLEGLKQTWWNGCEIAKKHGATLECSIYVSENPTNRDFNMLLVTKVPSAASSDPNAELYRKIQADVRAQLEQAKEDELVQGYEELRTFFGDQNFRRIDFTK